MTVTDTAADARRTRDRAFDPFLQPKPPDAAPAGTSIVHGIVSKAGGQFTTDREPGRGGALRLYWPVANSTSTEFDSRVRDDSIRGKSCS